MLLSSATRSSGSFGVEARLRCFIAVRRTLAMDQAAGATENTERAGRCPCDTIGTVRKPKEWIPSCCNCTYFVASLHSAKTSDAWSLFTREAPLDIPRLIVIGSSAGGIEALITLVSAIPEHFATPICIAQHTSPLLPSHLPAILTRLGGLPATHPPDGARLLGEAIFLAPPAHNLSVSGEHVEVTQALRQRSCPSVNLLFASAARSYGSGVIGVILIGLLSDGTLGLQAGGTTIIQNPLEAAYPSMPQSAQDRCAIDYCLALARIAPLLQQLAR